MRAGLRSLVAKQTGLVVVFVLVFSMAAPFMHVKHAQAYSGSGTGTNDSPFLITTCTELQNMAQNAADRTSLFWLANDIDCSASATWNGGDGFAPIASFTGTLDGRGHTIQSLYIHRVNEDNVGLFQALNNNSRVYNLTIDSASEITGHNAVGALVGVQNYSKVFGVQSQATVHGTDLVGGITGVAYGWNETAITQSSFTGEAVSDGTVGGMIGQANNGYNLENDFVNGTVLGSVAGGLIGTSQNSCGYRYINTSAVLGTVNGSSYSGGLVGSYNQQTCNETQINHSLADVLQPGTGVNGGIAGLLTNTSLAITDTYFNNTVVTDCVGQSSSSTLTSNDCTGTVSRSYASEAPYTNWDTTNVWQSSGAIPALLFPFDSPTGPTAPLNLSISETNDGTSAHFAWDASADGGTFGVNEYHVQLKKSADTWSQSLTDDTTSGTTYDFSSLKLGTSYDVRVQAVSEYSGSAWVTLHYDAPDPTVATITSCQQLQDLNSDENAYLYKIVLANDIDCAGIDFVPLGTSSNWISGTSFYGDLDGQGHTIKNLSINGDYWDAGLISEAYYGTMQNLVFEGGSVHGSGDVGTLAGYSEDVTFSNIKSDVSVTSDSNQTGGLAGYADFYHHNTLDRLVYTGDVLGNESSGGIFGEVDIYNPGTEVSLSQSYSTGTVSSQDNQFAGGLIGSLYSENEENDNEPDCGFTLQNSYSTADVTAANSAGGLIGHTESYNDGYVNSIAYVTLDKVYASGTVTVSGDQAGGLIGSVENLNYAGENLAVSNSFATAAVSASTNAYGLVGGNGYADSEGSFSTDHSFYDISATGQNQRDYLDGIENGFGFNETGDQPDHFKDNTTNVPLDTWDFDTVWETQADGLPLLRAFSPTDPGVSTTTTNLTSAEDGSKVVLTQTGCSAVGASEATKSSSLTVHDPAYSYPLGLVDFSLTGCSASTVVNLTFTGSFDPATTTIRKYNATTHTYTTLTATNSGLALTSSTLDGKPALVVTYTVADNGPLDQDATVGTISDPVGIAKNIVAVPNTGLGGSL